MTRESAVVDQKASPMTGRREVLDLIGSLDGKKTGETIFEILLDKILTHEARIGDHYRADGRRR